MADRNPMTRDRAHLLDEIDANQIKVRANQRGRTVYWHQRLNRAVTDRVATLKEFGWVVEIGHVLMVTDEGCAERNAYRQRRGTGARPVADERTPERGDVYRSTRDVAKDYELPPPVGGWVKATRYITILAVDDGVSRGSVTALSWWDAEPEKTRKRYFDLDTFRHGGKWRFLPSVKGPDDLKGETDG